MHRALSPGTGFPGGNGIVRATHGTLIAILTVWTLWVGCAATHDPVRTLTILHTNDLHARLLPGETGRGGFAHVATVIHRECEHAEACLVLDAGDLVQGSPVSSVFRGVPVFDVANRLGLDASTLGNHEFDYGWQQIGAFRETAEFPLLSANVVDPEGGLLGDAPYVVLERGGIRVGIIGVLTEDLPYLTFEKNYAPWRVMPVVEAVRRYLPELRTRADLVVVLGHLNDEEEQAVVSELDGVAALISGHGHEGLPDPRVVGNRVGVRARAYGEEVGRLDLRVRIPEGELIGWEWSAIPVRARDVPPLPAVARRVEHWEAKVAGTVDVPIGESKRFLPQAAVRSLFERALRDFADADLAYVNPGGVRDSLPEGRLLVRHVWNAMPFENTVVVGAFRAGDLPRSLVDERDLDPDRTYRLATMDFVADLWNRRREHDLEFEDTGRLVRDVVVEWIRERGVIE